MFDTRPRLIITSDLDHTMVAHDDPQHAALVAFNSLWNRTCAADSKLVFSTGRSYHLYKALRDWAPLLTPDLLVCSVGTEILHFSPGSDEPTEDAEWVMHLSEGWDRDVVETISAAFTDLIPQPESEQRKFKLSFHAQGDRVATQAVCNELQRQLDGEGLQAQVIFSGGVDVDILPARAGKGNALAFILEKTSERVGEPDDVMVCGDSGNDLELFRVPGVKGCMVSNAHEELRRFVEAAAHPDHFVATEPAAGAIAQAMHHFGLVPPRERRPPRAARMATVVHIHDFFREWFAGAIPHDEDTFARFSAAQDPGFGIVCPDGSRLGVGPLRDALYGLWGRDDPADPANATWTHTWLDNYAERQVGPDTWLLTYDEWQARRASQPFTARACTALLKKDDAAPEGWSWLHVHETWLPGKAPQKPPAEEEDASDDSDADW